MNTFQFNIEIARLLTQFDNTNFTLSNLLGIQGDFDVVSMELGRSFHMDYHQVTKSKLFMIVDGTGWIRTRSYGEISVLPGQAVFLAKGEWYEAGTDQGMSVIFIEGDHLEPAALMQ